MAAKSGKILIVDDNAGIRKTLKILLPLHFSEVETIPSPSLLFGTLERFKPDVVLLDMNFHTDVNTGNEGLYWTGEIKRAAPTVEVVLFTAYADIRLAVEGMKRGAFDFIVKPWENDKLISVLTSARDKAKRISAPKTDSSESMFWGTGARMQSIARTLQKIAPTDASVLITGENGTGKDMLAREIHARSSRHGKPFVAVDAGAIPEGLFESELFGHVKGAFTDARTDHAGKFEQADGGTLFLDEVGNIPLHLQAKLLRALQNRSIIRVGGTAPKEVDIRLICATNSDLEQAVREGRFREDLYYRINTVRIELPPLRERREDILPLADIFARRFAEKYRRTIEGFDEDAGEALKANRWNGNIRELQNLVEKAVIMSDGGRIAAADIQFDAAGQQPRAAVQMRRAGEEEDERLVRSAMERSNFNISVAARMLGISRPTLYAKLKKYKI